MNTKDILPLPSLRRVCELFDYNPDTGSLIRLIDVPKAPAGTIVGTRTKRDYLICRVDYRIYFVHRLAWLLYYREPPMQCIDHINGDGCDNRISNLRLATVHENGQNRKVGSNNLVGLKGAHYSKLERKWKSSIKHFGKNIHLGYFNTAIEAHHAYVEASHKYFGHFARTH